MVKNPIHHDDVVKAKSLISPYVPPTPLKHSEYFSKKLKAPVYFKLENLNISGSFKIRGAAHALLTSPLDQLKKTGIMTASAGNHAQGLAHMAHLLGIDTTIFMPKGTSLIKVESTKSYGAKVWLKGDNFTEAETEGRKWALKSRAQSIHAFQTREVVIGQGTVGIEILDQCPDAGLIIAPIGGGGLMSGIAAYAKGCQRHIRLLGIQSSLCCPVAQKLSASCPLTPCGKDCVAPLKAHATLADGIAVKSPSEDNLYYLRKWVDKVRCVKENDLAASIMKLLERDHILSEGAGAASVAALDVYTKEVMEMADGRPIVCVISGGNIDASLLARIMQKGLMHSSRMMRMRIYLEDHPGVLAQCLKLVASTGANLYHLDHNRIFNHQGVKEVEVSLDLEISHKEHAHEVHHTLKDQGYRVHVVADSVSDCHLTP